MITAFVGIAVFALVLLLGGLRCAASKPNPIDHPAEIREMLNRLYDERGYPRD